MLTASSGNKMEVELRIGNKTTVIFGHSDHTTKLSFIKTSEDISFVVEGKTIV
jgi:hypothetical protein